MESYVSNPTIDKYGINFYNHILDIKISLHLSE